MQSYKDYKKFDELWLESIPSQWNSRKIKYIFSERVQKGFPDEQLLVASQNMGVVPKDVYGNRTVEATKDLHLLKLVEIGDFVISLRSFQGGIEYAYYRGIISPAYTVMVANELICAGYFKYLAKSRLFIELLQMCVTGIREGQNIDYIKLKNHQIPVPPRPEQDQIVRYLDWKVSQINKLINAKRREIELLKEQKQAIINQAVTRGLYPDVPMKDSGIDWIGAVPDHWKITRIGHLYTSILGKMLAPVKKNETDSLENYICAKDIHFTGINTSDLKRMWFSPVEKKLYKVKIGDLLVVEGGAGAGGAYVCDKDFESSVFIQNSIQIIRNRGFSSNKFLYYWLYALVGRGYIDYACNKATIPHYTKDKLLETPIPVIPIEEQEQIVAFLNVQCAQIDTVSTAIKNEISLLHEYRTRLISDVVTGTVDVRDVAVPDYEAVEEIVETNLSYEDDEVIEIEDNDSADETVVAQKTKRQKQTPSGYKDAVILSVLVKTFSSNDYPFTAFDCQKFPYLFHRHIEGIAQGYEKFAAGPYNSDLKYKTAQPIALKKNYIRRHKGNYSGFVVDSNISEAEYYFNKMFGADALKWMEQFRRIPKRKDELELLTTVDMAMVELREQNKPVTIESVKSIIQNSEAWKAKLTRSIFSDTNIKRAIKWSINLFGTNLSQHSED
jgi:type I restriction enzyme S subunit